MSETVKESKVRFSCFVAGVPAPGGSKKAFVVNGRAIVTDDSKRSRPWKDRVATMVAAEYKGEPVLGPVRLYLQFVMPRPKGHFRTGKRANELRPAAPKYHTGKPDVTKLTRSTEDALTGILWRDDSQIALTIQSKWYADPGDRTGVMIAVEQLDPFAAAELGEEGRIEG